ncbi:hydrolase [Nocardiopsis ansamitocini]|uniref:Hydrolase n=1 Tax=Nocardiopsis ansamitocini TaxID=1670832 RepID=A0A9W6UJK5_9ACTN|nr:hydrolase [Nocardiopsis ansamitocini]
MSRPGGSVAYEMHGERNEGPLAVCVPGMASSRSSFRFLAPALAERGYRVAVLDLRGHGDSTTGFDDYGDSAGGSDLIALIEHLGGGRALLVGNSMGAAISTWVAAERPELVAALVLIGPFLRDSGGAPTRLAIRLLSLRPWGPAVLGGYLEKLYAGRTPLGHDGHMAAVRTALRSKERYRAIAKTLVTSHSEVEQRLDEVTAPSLVLMGALDPDWPDPAREAAWIGERIGSELMMVPDAGHYPQEQRPDLVAAAILAFTAGSTRG